MSRDSYREGADDAQHFGDYKKDKYLNDPAYAEGFDDYMKEHPLCACGEDAQPSTDPPMCTECLASHAGQPSVSRTTNKEE